MDSWQLTWASWSFSQGCCSYVPALRGQNSEQGRRCCVNQLQRPSRAILKVSCSDGSRRASELPPQPLGSEAATAPAVSHFDPHTAAKAQWWISPPVSLLSEAAFSPAETVTQRKHEILWGHNATANGAPPLDTYRCHQIQNRILPSKRSERVAPLSPREASTQLSCGRKLRLVLPNELCT